MTMVGFTHYAPTRLLFGEGQLHRLGRQDLPAGKALLVTSPGLPKRSPEVLELVAGQLEGKGVTPVPFHQVPPNPDTDTVAAAAERIRAEGCSLVIGLGGGSAMDAAKAAALAAVNPADYWQYASGKRRKLDAPPLPVIAIPTTAGTGAQVSPYAVITSPESGEKIGFGNPDTAPALAVVDPALTVSVPPFPTACQGFDAVFHAAETVLNRNSNPVAEMYALKALALLGAFLPAAVADGSDMEARTQVALAATLAGYASFSTSAHALEHALSGRQPSLPHGAGLLMLSRAWYRRFAALPACAGQFAKLAAALGVADFVEGLMDLEERCGVADLAMSAYGLTREELPGLAAAARKSAPLLFFGDPEPLGEEEAAAILLESYQ